MKYPFKTILIVVISSIAFSCSVQNKNNTSNNNQTPRKGPPPTFSQIITEMDTNKDGKLEKSEVKGPMLNDFTKIDTNEDGFISESEFDAAPRPTRNGPNQ